MKSRKKDLRPRTDTLDLRYKGETTVNDETQKLGMKHWMTSGVIF